MTKRYIYLYKCLLTLSLFTILGTPVYAFPNNSLRPGGVVVLSVAPSRNPKPQVSYNSKPVALFKGQQNWLAVIGISLEIGRAHV